jgi:riboflavin kinase / FMN adenylyltransferase
MKVYKSFEEIKHNPATVLTIGTFDGVHKGHGTILNRLKEIAQSENLRALVITFHPHPQTVLQRTDRHPVYLLTTIQERLRLFEKYDIEDVLIIPFSYEFSQTTPESFVKDYLIKKIGCSKILIGYDHFFGKNREGNLELLKKLSVESGFGVERLGQFTENDNIISSTKIRNELLGKNLEKANELLGYEYFIEGKVVTGDKRGAKLGIPTANIQSPHPNKLLPANGVYFVSLQINGNLFYGMANIGTRPTFTDETIRTLEVNIFDFDKDIYNKTVTVNFIRFIRDEKKFSGIDDFLVQLSDDRKKCYDFMAGIDKK